MHQTRNEDCYTHHCTRVSIYIMISKLHSEIHHLKTFLEKCKYSLNLMDSCIKLLLKNLYGHKLVVQNIPKKESSYFEPKARFKNYFLTNWGVSPLLLDPEPFFISNNKLFKMLSSGISLKRMFFHLILIAFYLLMQKDIK